MRFGALPRGLTLAPILEDERLRTRLGYEADEASDFRVPKPDPESASRRPGPLALAFGTLHARKDHQDLGRQFWLFCTITRTQTQTN